MVILNCPKCAAPIKWYDLSPNCKKCGVHIMYYTQEQDLMRDAKRTELEFARARVLVSKLKTNFIGGKYAITRLVFMLLSVGVLCIPFADIVISLPYWTGKISVGGIGIYSMISDSMYTLFFDFLKCGLAEGVALKGFITLAIFAGLVLLVAAMLIVYLLSFLNIRKYSRVLYIMTAIAGGLDLVSVIWVLMSKNSAAAYECVDFSLGFGGFVAFAVFGVFFALNFIIRKKDEPVPIKDVDLQRIEVYKKIKEGSLDIDTLSVPIFETEEERLARENALAGKPKEKKKKKKKEEKKDG